ncbi:MAG: InlB B-repeat-containing protein, partial [Clostridiales Family XIII bacterium]|nr:InlB B-repeat-containing protein [Clostridiales Family XIII bacterium]
MFENMKFGVGSKLVTGMLVFALLATTLFTTPILGSAGEEDDLLPILSGGVIQAFEEYDGAVAVEAGTSALDAAKALNELLPNIPAVVADDEALDPGSEAGMTDDEAGMTDDEDPVIAGAGVVIAGAEAPVIAGDGVVMAGADPQSSGGDVTLDPGSEAGMTEDTVLGLVPVTWSLAEGISYDGDVAGEYLFSAVLPEGFLLEEGVALPLAVVTVAGDGALDSPVEPANDGVVDEDPVEAADDGGAANDVLLDSPVEPANDEIQILAVPTTVYSVTFYNSDGSLYTTYYAQEGGAVSEPPVPSPSAADIGAGRLTFLGWYTDTAKAAIPLDADGHWVFSTPVTSGDVSGDNLNLTAVFSDLITVEFKDDAPNPGDRIVVSTEFVEKGGTVADPGPIFTPAQGNIFTGKWLYESGDANNGLEYDFATPVTANLVLVPQTEPGRIAYFHTSGGSYQAPYSIPNDTELVAEPLIDPTRTGYTFQYWSENPAADPGDILKIEEFDFSAPYTTLADLNLYAIWEGDTVSYKVIFWLDKSSLTNSQIDDTAEKDDPANYAIDRFENVTGQAGTTPTFSTGVRPNPSNTNLTNTGDMLYHSTVWDYNAETIEGDGSTVINVYCLRIPVTIRANITLPPGYTGAGYSLTFRKSDGGEVTFTGGEQYLIPSRFGANFRSEPNAFILDQGTANPSPVLKFNGAAQSQPSNWLAGEYQLSGLVDFILPLRANYLSGGYFDTYFLYRNNKSFHFCFYDEAIPNNVKPAGAVYTDWLYYNSRYYVKVTDVYALITGTGQYGNMYTSGYTPVGGTNFTTNGNNYQYPIYWTAGGENGTLTNPGGSSTNNSLNWVHLHNLNPHAITLNMQGGTLTDTRYTQVGSTPVYATAADIKYTYPVESYEPDLADMSYPGKEFDGWYTDADYLYPYDFTGATQSAAGLNLYAKWKPATQHVSVKYSQSSSTADATIDVLYGGTIADPGIFVVGQSYGAGFNEGYGELGNFKGWYWEDHGTVKAYAWANQIVDDSVTIFGMWVTSGYSLTYDVGNGTGTPPTDITEYAPNTSAKVKDGSALSDGAKVFANWKDLDTGAVYYPDKYITMAKRTTLTAQYVGLLEEEYTLTYKRNRDSSDITTSGVYGPFQRLAPVTVLANTNGDFSWTYDGHEFLGWSEVQSDTTADPNYPSPGYAHLTKNTTVFAVWKAIDYTVKFNPGNHGTFAEQTDVLHYTGSTPPNTPAPPAGYAVSDDDDYYFDGWDIGVTPTVTASVTYTAQWRLKPMEALVLAGLSASYTYGDAPDGDVGVTLSGGGALVGTGGMTYSVAPASGGPVSIAGNAADGGRTATLTILKPGDFTVTARKAADATYGKSEVTGGSITVNKAVPGVSVVGSGGLIYGQNVYLTATVSKVGVGAVPTGSVDIYVDTIRVAQNVALVGGKVENYDLGALSGGGHTLEVRYNGDGNYKANGAGNDANTTSSGAADSIPYSVGLATDSITIATPAAKVYGDSDFSLTLSANGNGGGAVTWELDGSSSTTVATITSGGSVHIVGTGPVTFKANRASDGNHNGCSATITFSVGKATPVVATVPGGSSVTYGQMLSDSTLSGGLVNGSGTEAGTALSGSFTWTAATTVPDVSGLGGADDDFYSVTWTPSGV